jgi:hypothetical protein
MTKEEYKNIQDKLTKKLHVGQGTNKTQAYDNGILAAKSIIKSIYEEE